MKTKIVVVIVSLSLWFTLALVSREVGFQRARIEALEKICHGQCKFGDQDCNERCQKAGHCPMQDQ